MVTERKRTEPQRYWWLASIVRNRFSTNKIRRHNATYWQWCPGSSLRVQPVAWIRRSSTIELDKTMSSGPLTHQMPAIRIWERMIRSMQKILEALFKEQIVNYENLLTVLCAVKRILADRPITPVSNSPKDPELLTPNNLYYSWGKTIVFHLMHLQSQERKTLVANVGAKHNALQTHSGDVG